MRPLTFDKQKALADVTELFWRQGYAGTSVQQLLDQMGINRSSMYATFGDKRALFLQSLDRFSLLTQAACMPLKQSDDPAIAIRQFYHLVFFSLNEEQRKLGCLLVNTVLEQSGLDNELASYAGKLLAKVEAEITACIQRGKIAGKVPESTSPELTAKYLMVVMKGLRVAAREGASESDLKAMIDIGLMSLGNEVASNI